MVQENILLPPDIATHLSLQEAASYIIPDEYDPLGITHLFEPSYDVLTKLPALSAEISASVSTTAFMLTPVPACEHLLISCDEEDAVPVQSVVV